MKPLNDIQRNFQSGQNSAYRVTSINTHISIGTQSAPVENHAVVALTSKPRMYSGYMKGYRQPVGLLSLRITSVNALQLNHLQLALVYYFPTFSSKFSTMSSGNEIAHYLGIGLCALQQMADFPIFEAPQLNTTHEKSNIVSLWVPMLYGDCLHQSIEFMLKLFNHHSTSTPFVPNKTLSGQFKTLVETLRAYAPKGRNSLRLLTAAHHEGIPWKHLAQNTFQYGYGIHSRWFDSTFTDKTSQIAASLARDKHCTSMLLHRANLPVPEQHVVYNEADAVSKANKMGYPVVIKPLNQDGGKGVFAKLMSDSAVIKAYQQARKFSAMVLLEKHIVGIDYRLVVLNEQLIWAIERTPAGVKGDGLNTIHTLVQKINQQPERGSDPLSPLKHIIITDDVTDFLAEQGFKLDSILKPGQFVPLNRIANISTGGTPVGVFDKVHPDNKRLVETAVNLLRLDIAGVDFISPDIQQSYLENGGKIIEINAQPQLGLITPSFIYENILSTLLPNQGRIPIIVICGYSPEHSFIQNLAHSLSTQYKNIGVVKENSAYMNDERLFSAPSLFSAGETLLLNHNLNALIYCITTWEDIENQGLPFDRYDTLFLFKEPILNKDRSHQADIDSINTLLRACRGQRIILETALEHLMKHKDGYEHNMLLALSELPQKIEKYPDFIEQISYLDDKNKLVIQSNLDGCVIQSLINTDELNDDFSNKDILLLSLMAEKYTSQTERK